MNHKLVYRLYREEGLSLRRKRPARRRKAANRTEFTSKSLGHWA